jgi:hypothetical protein
VKRDWVEQLHQLGLKKITGGRKTIRDRDRGTNCTHWEQLSGNGMYKEIKEGTGETGRTSE